MGRVRVLSENDVRHLVSPTEARQVVEQAFQDFANGISRMASRVTVPIPDIAGNMRILPAVKVMLTPRPIPLKVYMGYVGPVFEDPSEDRLTVLLYDMRATDRGVGVDVGM